MQPAGLAAGPMGCHRPGWVTPHARLTWKEVVRLHVIDFQKWLLRMQAVHALELILCRLRT